MRPKKKVIVRYKPWPKKSKAIMAMLPKDVKDHILGLIDSSPAAVPGVATSQIIHGGKAGPYYKWRLDVIPKIRKSVIMEMTNQRVTRKDMRKYRILGPTEALPTDWAELSFPILGDLFNLDHSTMVYLFKKSQRPKHEETETPS